MSTAAWAIAYDLDVKGMKNAGYSKSNVTQFYNNIRKCLQDNNFESMKQLSIYTCQKVNSITDAFRVVTDMKAVTDADKYIKRLNLFRVEDFNDLLPLIETKRAASDVDEIEEEIEEVFGEDANQAA